ncbi:AAA family ATPase [Candidatus Peregrinibacteria bacterium]|jgi:ATP-dependent DNA helicase PIF1|nr:AAA family ATPase [Candidatus Peregrinibacteria bacterium]MBT7484362.1 AAA family ATPase [Candidatus Peregrinibacteria bacterium]MBT7702752.1 AAA family ATPase [Candidatus Peregrinibacteria bacterium]
MKQNTAFRILQSGHNVYLGGSAGTGKTHLLNRFIDHLKEEMVMVGITASTGIAATHLNGITIHSWSGLGIREQLSHDDIKKLRKRHYLRQRIIDTEVLIIDEISMLSAEQLDTVDTICREFRKCDLPFGGLQVVLSGDFFQLPPVVKNGASPRFAYDSDVWKDMNIKICYLTEPYRQHDKKFLKILNEIRSNEVSKESLKLLEERTQQSVKKRATKLYTHNADVDSINYAELDKIDDDPRYYLMNSSGLDVLVDALKKHCLTSENLVLKKGAMVMFVKNNFEKGYVNGTLGKVTGFDAENFPIVKTYDGKKIKAKPVTWAIEEDDEIKAKITQIPLRLAWAITVHKSQGMSLDAAEIDLSRSFVPGMGYVALSRVKSLKGIELLGINEMSLSVDPMIIKLDKKLRQASEEVEEELG